MDRYIADQLITMADGTATSAAPGVVDVKDGRVAWSGAASEAPVREHANVHRIAGVLIPGMVNTHCHTPMVLLRGVGEGLPVHRWLREIMWPLEAKLTPDDVRVGMKAGAAEQLLNGVTTSLEMYFHSEAVAAGVEEIGSRALIASSVITEEALSHFGTWEQQLDDAIKLRDAFVDSDHIVIGIGPHDPTVPEDCLRAIGELALEQDMMISTHVAEGEHDVAAIRDIAGTSVVSYLESIGLLEPRFVAAHGVWLSDEDMRVFATHGASVAHCPCSNMKHGTGTARVVDLMSAGVNVAVATDGPASHHRLDMFEEMRTAVRLARVRSENADVLAGSQVLAMATSNAADAIGWPDIGRLSVGSWADMVALSPDSPALNPIIESVDQPAERVVWSGSPQAVAAVWVAGKKVVEQGRLVKADMERLTAEATQVANKLAN
jgi:5-methylthioadenosine/S-adenosylhomocysteine deaminase